MNYISASLLFIESALYFYMFLFPRGYLGQNPLELILGFIFLVLGVVGIKKYQNRLFKWFVILFSLLLGPGGFIGIGGLCALLLAIYFIILSKNRKKNQLKV
jgi:hypothetical protein